MKYKFKIDTPMGDKGQEAPSGFWVKEGTSGRFYYLSWQHGNYPEIFEPIVEKTPEERVAQFIEREWRDNAKFDAPSTLRIIAQRLIDAGLDPDKLEGM